jgi:RimJ/RimL family protein N-acetyltransferase
MPETRIVPLTPGGIETLLDHWERYDAQSGREGDLPYGPGDDEPPPPREERRGSLDAALRTPVARPDWTRVWIATADDAAVGHVLLRWVPPGGAAHRAWCSIGVERAHRGAGVGRRLLRAAIDWAGGRPELDWIDLGVFAANERAVALYRAEGFVETGRVPDRFRVGGMSIEDITMSRRLAAADGPRD